MTRTVPGATFLLLLVPATVLATVAPLQETPPTGGAMGGADLQLLSSVRTIAETVEQLRGESFERPPLAVRAPDTMRQVAAEIRAFNVLPRARLEARGRAWADIGLGSATSPTTLFVTLAADLEGVAFDPDGNRLLVAPDRLTEKDFAFRETVDEAVAGVLRGEPAGSDEDPDVASTVLMMTGVRIDEPLVGHALTHVRQRERDGGDWLEPFTDGLLARSAWSEGEANLVAVRYLFHGMGLSDDVLQVGLGAGDLLDGSLTPPGLEALSGIEAGLVGFVYDQGFAIVSERYREGGWAAVAAGMRRERTTHAMLNAKPTDEVAFAEPSPPAAGLARVDEDSLGVLPIIVLISTWTGKDNLGLIVADGWLGDRLYRWESPDRPGSGITEWVTRWSSAARAVDFLYGFERTLKARFPGGVVDEARPGLRTLTVGGNLFHMETRGTEIRILVSRAAPQRGQV